MDRTAPHFKFFWLAPGEIETHIGGWRPVQMPDGTLSALIHSQCGLTAELVGWREEATKIRARAKEAPSS